MTEMVSGVDLVKWQIRVAAGAELPFKQSDIKLTGHAIEYRINAEDPLRNFAPCCGQITLLHTRAGRGCGSIPRCIRGTAYRRTTIR